MKKIKIYYLLPLLLLIFTAFSFQSDFREIQNPKPILDQIKQVASQTHTISASFTEEKHLAAFKQPQISKGKFYYAEKDKLRWEQKTPFDYLILINGKQLIIRDNGVVKKNSAGTKMVAKINEFMLSLIQGNYQNDKMSLRCFESGTQYQIELTPKSNMLSKVYTKLNLYFSKSDKRLQHINFFESGGDTKTMRFTDQVYNGTIDSKLFSL